MYKLISNFPDHINEAISIFEKSAITPKEGIQNIIITGLGGSGIGGTIVSDIVEQDCKVPILINKRYDVPAFVNENTLVIACSYSGNTEETLLAAGSAIEKGAQVSVITSGGVIETLAKDKGFDHVVIPGGNPPRSMLGYSLTVLLLLLHKYGFTSIDPKGSLLSSSNLLRNEQSNMKMQASELASKTSNKITVTYAATGFSGVATRWRQQFNENAKLPGWDAEIPEMNHNELVGWAGGSDLFVVYILRSTEDYNRNQKRIEISSEIIQRNVKQVYEIWTQGVSKVEQAFYLIHFGDWISYYLSEERNVDIFDIKVIDHLKSELSKF